VSAPTFVLMYHRVCPLTSDTACWHARGTAITPDVFRAQIAWVRARARLLTLQEWVREAHRDDATARCVVTFDDGYRDVEAAVQLGIPVTVFPVAQHTGGSPELLWFDRYYVLLHRARRRAGVTLRALDLDGIEPAPPIDEALTWWVRGALKEQLQGMSHASRRRALDRLADVLDAYGETRSDELYLSVEELRTLSRNGHCVGGHGATHTRLTQLEDESLAGELAASMSLLTRVGVGGVRTFCYPDGAHDPRVMAAVTRAGFSGACTVVSGVAASTTDLRAIPRLLMRNVMPGAEGWPTMLETMLERRQRDSAP